MGRVFVLEFDDFDMKNFYVCKVCHTPLARATDVSSYWRSDGIWVEEYVSSSLMTRLSNVVISCVVEEARVSIVDTTKRYFHCIACNNQVGVRYVHRQDGITIEGNHLQWEKIMYRIAGSFYHPDRVSPEVWFDSPRPHCNGYRY